MAKGFFRLWNLTAKSVVAIYLCGMSMLRIIFELFVIYIIYKLVVDFIIPVYRTTSQMKNAMHKAQEQMRQQQQQQTAAQPENPTRKTAVNNDDYIDYEEVK